MVPFDLVCFFSLSSYLVKIRVMQNGLHGVLQRNAVWALGEDYLVRVAWKVWK